MKYSSVLTKSSNKTTMNLLTKTLILEAGFKPDSDGNFSGLEGWQNQQLVDLQHLVCVDICRELAQQLLGSNCSADVIDWCEQFINQQYKRYDI